MPNAIRQSILSWYGKNARDLPWRRTRDPYAVWVSEVMLQQTRVETVVDYYGRFLTRFPTIESLARATLQRVLKAWEGMGYYARARNLHRAARESLERYWGFAPSHGAFLDLPGVGKYTAAAVWAVVFGEPRLPLDGNIRRVLSRLFDLDTLREGPYFEVGEALLQGLGGRRVSRMVQALMELGALVCRPRTPACRLCPVRTCCKALARGTVEERPPKRPKLVRPHYPVAIAYLRSAEGKVLLARRDERGMLGGLWELPGGKAEGEEDLRRALGRELREELGIRRVPALKYVGCVDHAYTHFSVTLHLFEGETSENPGELDGPAETRWVSPRHLWRYPLPRGTQKALELRAERP